MAHQLMMAQKSYAPVPDAGNVNPLTVVSPAPPPAPPARKAKPAKPKDYRVRAGDSLMGIAREHNCDVSDLARENHLQAPGYMIKPGQRIKLKGCED